MSSRPKKNGAQLAFLVFGYGVPKNILEDPNYNTYLKMVFNKIYDDVTQNGIKDPLIVCSGGKTDMFPPYKRTEAEEMVLLLTSFAKRPFLRTITNGWTFVAEKRSLSTLENLLFCKETLTKRKRQSNRIVIFCEQTRARRIQQVAKKVFAASRRVKVMPIDFDVSSNRYLDPAFLAKKERTELKHSLWALKSPENLKKHHKAFQEKVDYFRRMGPDLHVDTIRTWWEEKLKEIEQ